MRVERLSYCVNSALAWFLVPGIDGVARPGASRSDVKGVANKARSARLEDVRVALVLRAQ